MFIWDFVADTVLGQIIDWLYGQIVGFLGDFFMQMGSMGAELFEMSWVQSVVLLFYYLAWALYVTGIVVAAFECGIEYQNGRGSMKDEGYQMTLFDLDTSFGKMSLEHSAPQMEKISGRSSRRLSISRTVPVMCLDLTPGAGNLLGLPFWEINSAWLGESWMLNTGESPSAAVESSLSQILEDSPHQRYYLSKNACLGILRRAKVRGKELPPQLEIALRIQAGVE